MAFAIILLLAIVIFLIVAQWRVFEKAGRPGWAIIVPIYGNIVQLQVAKLNPWLVLIYLTAIIPILGPIVTLIMNIIVSHRISTAFGHGVGFTLGLIFLPFIFIPILAFGDSEYIFDEE